MRYTIVLSEDSVQDLEDILVYYATACGTEFGDEVYERIDTALNSLATLPKRCPSYPRLPNLRQLLIDKLPYRAYFRVDEDESEVQIVRILHTSRNHGALL